MVKYAGKLVLAPMVRAGELPTRLLALKYGADLVWGPEIVDKKLMSCERVVNEDLGTVDFLSRGQTKIPGVTNLVFRTHSELESSKIIFQMGTADPGIAVQAAKLIIGDVSGIDINAGCPKHFSIHAGMGAALLKTPELLASILTDLVEHVGKPNNKPISVKIRLLPNEKDTLDLVERLLKTGISNLTVHCRTQHMRNRETPIRDYLDKIKEKCEKYDVSLIINGNILDRNDFNALQGKYGESVGGMIASCAEINPTCFSTEPLPWSTAIKEYTEIAKKYNNFVGNTKYMLTRMIPGKSFMYQLITRSKTYEEFFENFKKLDEKILEGDHAQVVARQKKAIPKRISEELQDYVEDTQAEGKKHTLDSSVEIIPKRPRIEQVSTS